VNLVAKYAISVSNDGSVFMNVFARCSKSDLTCFICSAISGVYADGQRSRRRFIDQFNATLERLLFDCRLK
jgi:hypothetical protein